MWYNGGCSLKINVKLVKYHEVTNLAIESRLINVPIEWVQLRDGNAGETYHWNKRPFTTSWKPPPGIKVGRAQGYACQYV